MDRSQLIAALRLEEFDPAPDLDYAISPFCAKDAPGVARLTCRIYGDSHPFDYVYDPKRIAQLYANGTQYALVARSPAGEVLGMIGLYRCAPWPRIFELAQLMILQNQRGRGMAKDLWERAMRELPALAGADLIFGEAVCTHAFSQKMCRSCGMIACGLAVDAIPATAYGAAPGDRARTSLLLCAKPLQGDEQSVFLPEAYRQAYEIFCRKARLARTIREPRQERQAPASTVEIVNFAAAGCVKIWVSRAGEDLARIAAERESLAGDQGIVEVGFNLDDAGCLDGIAALRQAGYYFAGFLPRWFGSDGLLLQRRKDAPAFSPIELSGDDARYLLDLAQKDQESAGSKRAWGKPA